MSTHQHTNIQQLIEDSMLLYYSIKRRIHSVYRNTPHRLHTHTVSVCAVQRIGCTLECCCCQRKLCTCNVFRLSTDTTYMSSRYSARCKVINTTKTVNLNKHQQYVHGLPCLLLYITLFDCVLTKKNYCRCCRY
jgi:hypothetical protein